MRGAYQVKVNGTEDSLDQPKSGGEFPLNNNDPCWGQAGTGGGARSRAIRASDLAGDEVEIATPESHPLDRLAWQFMEWHRNLESAFGG